MISITPFRAIRPTSDFAHQVAALPYDVVTDEEAKIILKANPYSFLAVDKAEVTLEWWEKDKVYEKAAKTLQQMIDEGIFQQDDEVCFYLYGLETQAQKQYGIVGCFACEDYWKERIKKHENTREDKEVDRIKHVAACKAHTGPIFLAYKQNESIHQCIEKIKKEDIPIYDFIDCYGVRQLVYKIQDHVAIKRIIEGFQRMDALYIADGHHRAAAACAYAKEQNEKVAACNVFLGVAFAQDELKIMDYNRIVTCEEEVTEAILFEKLKSVFSVERVEEEIFKPMHRHEIGMRYHKVWYRLQLKQESVDEADPVASLDVAILQDKVLEPIFAIKEPRTDKRLQFIGGIHGIEALNEGSQQTNEIAFSLYPTSLEELFKVADAGKLMPPKSTWFEPKLRSGLLIHKI